jgi:hypothetical protein
MRHGCVTDASRMRHTKQPRCRTDAAVPASMTLLTRDHGPRVGLHAELVCPTRDCPHPLPCIFGTDRGVRAPTKKKQIPPTAPEEHTVQFLVGVIMVLHQHRVNKLGQCRYCAWTSRTWWFWSRQPQCTVYLSTDRRPLGRPICDTQYGRRPGRARPHFPASTAARRSVPGF